MKHKNLENYVKVRLIDDFVMTLKVKVINEKGK